jgi:hypothetical protein
MASAVATEAHARVAHLEQLLHQQGTGTMASPDVAGRRSTMNQTLRYVWGEYRVWAMTSRELKARVQRVSLVVLGLMIGGTALGTLSPLLGGAGALASASDGWTSGLE